MFIDDERNADNEAIKELKFIRETLSDDKRLAKALDIAINGIKRDINALALIEDAYVRGKKDGYEQALKEQQWKNMNAKNVKTE